MSRREHYVAVRDVKHGARLCRVVHGEPVAVEFELLEYLATVLNEGELRAGKKKPLPEKARG